MTTPRMKASFGGTAFDAGSRTSVELGAYRPNARSPDAAILGDRNLTDPRVRDMERNSGLVYAAVDRKIDGTVGASLRPQIKPNFRVLGITPEAARELGREMEAAWDVYANDPDFMCDAGRRLSLPAMARVEYWHWQVDGRAATVPLWLPRYGAEYGTTFMSIDPTRISNPHDKPDSRYLRGGVELDRYGAAVAYYVREQNPGDLLMADGKASFTWTRIPAYTRWGRRRMIYAFNQRQAEQSQGRSPLLAALKKTRMLEKRDDLELSAAAHLATFGMYVKSEVPSDALFSMMSQAPTGGEASAADAVADLMAFTAAYYDRNAYLLAGVAVPHLLPNEEIGTVSADRANSDFTASQRQWMTYFGWSLGLTYEQVSGDFSKSAYVGIKAGFAVADRSMKADRKMFAGQTQTPKLDLFLEEAFADGRIKVPAGAPSYEDARSAYLCVEWIGPGPISIDPTKEANAAATNMETGRWTLEQVLAEDGIDAEDQIAQLGREAKLREAAGLPPLGAMPVDPAAADANADAQTDTGAPA